MSQPPNPKIFDNESILWYNLMVARGKQDLGPRT